MNNRPANQRKDHIVNESEKKSLGVYTDSRKASFEENEEFLKILIFTLVILLALVFILFFSLREKTDDSLPVINTSNTEGTGTSDKTDVPKTDEPPYVPVPKYTDYIATDTSDTKTITGINSGYAVLVDLSDMSVIAGKYADELIYPASMTKIMTVVVACDLITDLDAKYPIRAEIISKVPSGASNAYLSSYIGKEATVRDLLYGITYRSGADSVICLLDYLGLSEEEFTSLMNRKAKEIGLTKTHFGGAIGMDTENNTTTCREMAAILAYALDNPLCKQLFGGKVYHPSFAADLTYYHSTITNTLESDTFKVNDQIVVDGYKMAAAKSGYETKAGFCLASYTESIKTGNGYILVTAHADTDKENPIKDYISVFKRYLP